MKLTPLNLPESEPARNYTQEVFRLGLISLQSHALYTAAKFADLGWDKNTEKYGALLAFVEYNDYKIPDKKICAILGLAIKQRNKEAINENTF